MGLFSCRAHTHWPPCTPPASQNFLHKWDRRSHLQSLPRDPDPAYEMTALELLFRCVAPGRGGGQAGVFCDGDTLHLTCLLRASQRDQGGDPERSLCSCCECPLSS